MTEKEILIELRYGHMGRLQDSEENPAWKSFCARMKNRQYGFDALFQAWSWFQTGWSDSEKKR